MANIRQVIKDSMGILQQALRERKVSNPEEALKAQFGANLATEELALANQSLSSINDILGQTLKMVKDSTGATFTEAQEKAAQYIAPMALSLKAAPGIMRQFKTESLNPDIKQVSALSIGVEDGLDVGEVSQQLSLATESYDPQKLNNAVYFSIVHNLAAATQDAFAEAFFPTITIAPEQSGIDVVVQFTSIYKEFTRSIKGTPDKFNRVPLAKSLYDNSIMGIDKFKVVPVYRENQNKDLFLESEKYENDSTGDVILTAPLLFGKEVSLLGLSQTDALLAKGEMDQTDALDRAIFLDKIYVELTKTDDSTKEIFAIPTSLYKPHSGFTYMVNGHTKNLSLNFKVDSVVINTSTTRTSKDAESVVLKALPENHTATLEIVLNGQASVQDGNIVVYGASIKVLEFRNAAGQVISSSDSNYANLKTCFDTIALKGYEVEAYRTNSNIRSRGRVVTSDAYAHRFEVPYRSGITAQFPTHSLTGTDGDANSQVVLDQTNALAAISSAYAVKTIMDTAATLKASTHNGLTIGNNFFGIGQYLVDPYFNHATFDLSSVVDSLESSERDDDVRASLRQRILNEVMDMYIKSNYAIALESVNGALMEGQKIGVVVGTDPNIKRLIVKDQDRFDLNSQFECLVVSSLNPVVRGQVFIAFTIFDASTRNSVVSPLSFGNRVFSPSISYEVTKSDNGAVSRELHTQPRFLHIVHLPVLSQLTISDVKGVFNKVTLHTKPQS